MNTMAANRFNFNRRKQHGSLFQEMDIDDDSEGLGVTDAIPSDGLKEKANHQENGHVQHHAAPKTPGLARKMLSMSKQFSSRWLMKKNVGGLDLDAIDDEDGDRATNSDKVSSTGGGGGDDSTNMDDANSDIGEPKRGRRPAPLAAPSNSGLNELMLHANKDKTANSDKHMDALNEADEDVDATSPDDQDPGADDDRAAANGDRHRRRGDRERKHERHRRRNTASHSQEDGGDATSKQKRRGSAGHGLEGGDLSRQSRRGSAGHGHDGGGKASRRGSAGHGQQPQQEGTTHGRQQRATTRKFGRCDSVRDMRKVEQRSTGGGLADAMYRRISMRDLRSREGENDPQLKDEEQHGQDKEQAPYEEDDPNQPSRSVRSSKSARSARSSGMDQAERSPTGRSSKSNRSQRSTNRTRSDTGHSSPRRRRVGRDGENEGSSTSSPRKDSTKDSFMNEIDKMMDFSGASKEEGSVRDRAPRSPRRAVSTRGGDGASGSPRNTEGAPVDLDRADGADRDVKRRERRSRSHRNKAVRDDSAVSPSSKPKLLQSSTRAEFKKSQSFRLASTDSKLESNEAAVDDEDESETIHDGADFPERKPRRSRQNGRTYARRNGKELTKDSPKSTLDPQLGVGLNAVTTRTSRPALADKRSNSLGNLTGASEIDDDDEEEEEKEEEEEEDSIPEDEKAAEKKTSENFARPSLSKQRSSSLSDLMKGLRAQKNDDEPKSLRGGRRSDKSKTSNARQKSPKKTPKVAAQLDIPGMSEQAQPGLAAQLNIVGMGEHDLGVKYSDVQSVFSGASAK